VDCLALRGQLGPALGPLLADPAVEKVLHGADSDVLWLQVRRRLLGLYGVDAALRTWAVYRDGR
jgi:ribonuclease D